MSQKDTINRAYGNTPKEIPNSFSFLDFIPESRTVRYIWIKWIARKLFR